MDAVEFIKARERMCKSLPACNSCPLNDNGCPRLEAVIADKIVDIVEQWAKEHPIKTRQSVFLEQWPNVELDYKGIVTIYPCEIDKTMYKKYKGCFKSDCSDCRREFWMQEVE